MLYFPCRLVLSLVKLNTSSFLLEQGTMQANQKVLFTFILMFHIRKSSGVNNELNSQLSHHLLLIHQDTTEPSLMLLVTPVLPYSGESESLKIQYIHFFRLTLSLNFMFNPMMFSQPHSCSQCKPQLSVLQLLYVWLIYLCTYTHVEGRDDLMGLKIAAFDMHSCSTVEVNEISGAQSF